MTPRNYLGNSKPGRLRSDTHRRFIRKHLCLAYLRKECQGRVECAHFRDFAPRGHGGPKPGDEWSAPLCVRHHNASEKRERAWCEEMGIDGFKECHDFASRSPDRAIKEAAKEMRRT